MNLISCEKSEKSIAIIQFSIDAETLEKAANIAFQRENKKYTVPGFRRGKATRTMIERMYGSDIFLIDAVNDLFADEFQEALKQAGVTQVGMPEPEIVSISAAEGAVIKVKVAVKPEVKLGRYIGLTAEIDNATVQDSDVDAELVRMQNRNARQITREGAAQNGDIVSIDYEGFIGENPFKGGKGENVDLILGSNSFIPGFEEQIVGHTAGDSFSIEVKFPDDYHAEDLKGKDATFAIRLHEVKYKEYPELDDDFAKDVSDCNTIAELKDSIRTELQDSLHRAANQKMENDLVQELVRDIEVEIPDVMIEEQAKNLESDFYYRLEQQGMGRDAYLEYTGLKQSDILAQFAKQAESQVRTRLALEAVAKKEKLEVTKQELDQELSRIAGAYRLEVDQILDRIDEEEVKDDLLIGKAVDFIKRNAIITNRNPSEEQQNQDAQIGEKVDLPGSAIPEENPLQTGNAETDSAAQDASPMDIQTDPEEACEVSTAAEDESATKANTSKRLRATRKKEEE